MKSRFSISVSVLLCVLLIGTSLGLWACGETPGEPQTSTTRTTSTRTAATIASSETRLGPSAEAIAHIPTLVAGNTAFALDLFAVIRGAEDNSGKNMVFSPHSLSLALAMTYAGARGTPRHRWRKPSTSHCPRTNSTLPSTL